MQAAFAPLKKHLRSSDPETSSALVRVPAWSTEAQVSSSGALNLLSSSKRQRIGTEVRVSGGAIAQYRAVDCQEAKHFNDCFASLWG